MDCSEAAAEELAQAKESWKRLIEVVSDEDDGGESDDDGGERAGGLDREPMEEVALGGGKRAEDEDETPVQQVTEKFADIRRKWEKRWQAGLRYYTQVGLAEGDEADEADED